MIILFWILTGLIFYAYVGYPIVLFLISTLFGRHHHRDDSFLPTMSLLIPAYNEEAIIGAKIENALALDYPEGKLEIIVASESDDGTDAIVRRYADRGIGLVSSPVRRGKVANLGRAVPVSKGDILVFTDANAMFRPDALRKLARNFAGARVGAVSGRLVYTNPSGAAAAAGEGAYWGFEMMLKRASSRLGSLPGANGSLYALRRELYAPITERRGDDFELPIRVIIRGKDSILEPEAISEEMAGGRYRDEFRRKVRIINWMFVSALILLREAIVSGRWLIAFQLLSHKLNRWAVPFWLTLLFPISLLLAPRGGVYLAAAVAQAALLVAALAGRVADKLRLRVPKILMLPYYFTVVNLAAAAGILTAVARREVHWHKRADGGA